MRRLAKPSDVMIRVSSFVRASPSGSRLSAANGWPLASRRVVTPTIWTAGPALPTPIRSV
jgi:hypothetical protein